MPFTAQAPPKPFRQNYFLQALLMVYFISFLTTAIVTRDGANWLIENTLSTILLGILALSYRYRPLSDMSYLMLALFMMLHIYGAMQSYSLNPLGLFIKEVFGLERNYYDRIVHFSLGFLASYALFDYAISYLKVPRGWALLIPIEMTLSISGAFEIVEYLWASTAYPELGPAYLGHQGDVWDAQKDMLIATAGSAFLMLFVFVSGIGQTTSKSNDQV